MFLAVELSAQVILEIPGKTVGITMENSFRKSQCVLCSRNTKITYADFLFGVCRLISRAGWICREVPTVR